MIMGLIACLPLIMAWLSQAREAGGYGDEEKGDCGCSAVGTLCPLPPLAHRMPLSLKHLWFPEWNFMPALLADSG